MKIKFFLIDKYKIFFFVEYLPIFFMRLQNRIELKLFYIILIFFKFLGWFFGANPNVELVAPSVLNSWDIASGKTLTDETPGGNLNLISTLN